jgi:hypothetical protein
VYDTGKPKTRQQELSESINDAAAAKRNGMEMRGNTGRSIGRHPVARIPAEKGHFRNVLQL